jgi:hypothetical protein
MFGNTFKDSDEFKDFVEQAKKDKKGRHLHTRAQKQLTLYLNELYPYDYTTSEIAGVLGGRNDSMHFAFDEHCAVFEFFFSPSQVPQDLRLLEQANANIKIAILLDKEINPKLASEYFHKKPNPFPFLWLSDLLIASRKKWCLLKLHKLMKLPDIKTPFRYSLFMPTRTRPLASKIITVENNDFSGLISALSSTESLRGIYDFSGTSLVEALPEMFQKIQDNLEGTPVSFTVGITSIESTSISSSSDIKGNITVQY